MITLIFLLSLFVLEVKSDKPITIYGFINEYQKIKTYIEVFAQYSSSVDYIRLSEKGEFKYRTILSNMTLYLCFSLRCDAECYTFKEATSKYYERIEFNFSNKCNDSHIISYYNLNNTNQCGLIEEEEEEEEEEQEEKEKLKENVEVKEEDLIGPKDIIVIAELMFIFNVVLHNIHHEKRKKDREVIILPFLPEHPLLLDGYACSDVEIVINHIYNENDN